MPDRHIDAFDTSAFLVDDGIDRDGGLAGLTVTDDELALSPADRHHRVNGLEPSLHRLRYRLTRDHAGCDAFDRRRARGFDWAFSVYRFTQ